MNKLFQVIKFEFSSTVRQKGIIFSFILLGVLTFVGGFLLVSGLKSLSDSVDNDDNSHQDAPSEIVYIYDEYNILNDYQFNDDKYLSLSSEVYYVDSKDEIIKNMEIDENINGFIIDGQLEFTEITLDTSISMMNFDSQLSSVISTILKDLYIKDSLDLTDDDLLVINNSSVKHNVETMAADESMSILGYIVFSIGSLMVYMALLIFGGGIVSNIVKEKKNRLVEILITCLKPTHLLFGKVLSYTLLVVCMLLLMAIGAILGIVSNLAISGLLADVAKFINTMNEIPFVADAISFILEFLVLSFIVIVISCFLYFSLFAALGSLVTEIEESNSVILPVTMIIIVSFLVTLYNNSQSLIDIMSYIPFTAPFAILKQIACQTANGMELFIMLIWFATSGAIICLFAAKVYRSAILIYGKKVSFKEVLRVIKSK